MDMLFNQSFTGLMVLLFLLSMSVWSWAVAISKGKYFSKLENENTKFMEEFWKGLSFEELLARCTNFPNSSLSTMYREVSAELIKMKQSPTGKIQIENIERVLNKSHNEQLNILEKNLGALGSIGSTAPFIGLFGTVVGIMFSFSEIGKQKSASLAVVAPGISEALIATAIGLFVAIPSVMFFNRFQSKLKKIEQTHFSFISDFLNILSRKYN